MAGEEVELRAVQPLAALLTALQSLVPGSEEGAAHPPRAHGLLGEERPRLAGLEHKHCRTQTEWTQSREVKSGAESNTEEEHFMFAATD